MPSGSKFARNRQSDRAQTLTASLSAADRRHRKLRALATPPFQFRTTAKLQIPAHANPDLADTLAVAGNRNGVRAQPGIGLEEGLFHFRRRHLPRLVGFEIFR